MTIFRIAQLKREEKVSYVPSQQYDYKPTGSLQWAQKLAWKFLAKLNAVTLHMNKKVAYSYAEIDTDKVINRIIESSAELFRINEEPYEVIMGQEDYSEMMRQLIDTDLTFSFQAEYRISHFPRPKIMGLQVTIVPYMRGLVVLPRRNEA